MNSTLIRIHALVLALAAASCQTAGTRILADCVMISTPSGIIYYLCEDPLSYCYVGSRGGLSCFPKTYGTADEVNLKVDSREGVF
jgi:hypothetical protein